jgi:replicative DNA helicase
MTKDLKEQLNKIIQKEYLNKDEIVLRLKKLIVEIESQSNSIKDSKTISQLYSKAISSFNEKNSAKILIKTGFTDLDNLIGGFAAGEFVVIGGRPSMGTTQLLVNLSLNISVKHAVLYFSLDLSEVLLTNRFISAISNIANYKFQEINLSKEECRKVASYKDKIEDYNIYINDSGSFSIAAFKEHCSMHIHENSVKIIIVDFLQMIGSVNFGYAREQELAYLCRELKNIAKENNICVIAASQISRAAEERGSIKTPLLSDLADSAAIEEAADKVIFIYRPEYYGYEEDEDTNNVAGLIELIVAKNTNGCIGKAKLMRNVDFTSFEEFEHIPTIL